MEQANNYFETVKTYLIDLGYDVSFEGEDNSVLGISEPEDGLSNLFFVIEDPVLVIEQYLFDLVTDADTNMLKELLTLNGEIVHGALALIGNRIVFRDTLRLENLDENELEASINSLKLFLSENLNKLLEFAHPMEEA